MDSEIIINRDFWHTLCCVGRWTDGCSSSWV